MCTCQIAVTLRLPAAAATADAAVEAAAGKVGYRWPRLAPGACPGLLRCAHRTGSEPVGDCQPVATCTLELDRAHRHATASVCFPPAGVIASEATLASMWRKFVAAPLWGHAEKLPAGSSGSASTSSASWQEQSRALAQALHQRRHVLLPAAAAVAAVAAGMLIWRRRASSM